MNHTMKKTMNDKGSAMIRESQEATAPSNNTCFPVIHLHMGRNTELEVFTNRAQNR